MPHIVTHAIYDYNTEHRGKMTRTTETPADSTMAGLSRFAETPTARFRRSLGTIGIALFPTRVVLFTAFFAWYLYAMVDVRLTFQVRGKLFLWNLHYFTDFLGYPGSLLEWADSLLVQLCHYGWPGVIALAAIMWLLLVSTIGLMNTLGRATVGGTWVIPGIGLMALYGQYNVHTSAIVGMALAMTAANGWCRVPVRQLWFRLVLFVVVSAVLYYVAGGAYYCFAACCLVHEAFVKKRRLETEFLLLVAVGVKFAVDVVLDYFNPASRYFQMPSINSYKTAILDWRVILLYLYFPMCALFIVFRQSVGDSMKRLLHRFIKSNGKKNSKERCKGKNHEKSVVSERTFMWKNVFGRYRWIAGTFFVMSLAATVGYYSVDRDLKAYLEIDYCAEHEMWNDVLAKARNLPPRLYQAYVNHDVNLALYHTGRLPYDMFSYIQANMPLFYLDQIPIQSLYRKPCDLLLALGRVNEAELVALELQQINPTSGTLKRLALVKMIKHQPAAASVFLNVLRDDLTWDHWAEAYLQRLATDPDLASDEEIQQKRRLMISEDDVYLVVTNNSRGELSVDYRVMLLNLLKNNGKNRMAFEYLMVIDLLTRDVESVVESFAYLDNFSYSAIPPIYEEAALIYSINHPVEFKTNGSEVSFRGRRISEASLTRYRRFKEIVAPYGGPNESAKSAVARELGDSYFFYYSYGIKDQQ